MADLMTVSFLLFAVSAVLGGIAVYRRRPRQVRIYFGAALISLLLVFAALVALSLSGGA